MDRIKRALDAFELSMQFNSEPDLFYSAVVISTEERIAKIVPGMAQAIFDDLAWQYEAYIHGGIKEIEAHAAKNEISNELLKAWQDIASGVPERVSAGTLELAKHEQVVSLNIGYAQLHSMWFVPGMMSRQAQSDLEGVASFIAAVPGGDITDIDLIPAKNDRWKWVGGYVVPAWSKMSQQQRDAYVNDALEFFAQ